MFYRYIEEFLNKNWDDLRKSPFRRIRHDVLVFDRFWPFVLSTEGSLLLNDRGISMEITTGFEVNRDALKRGLKEVYGEDFTDEQIDADINSRSWLNFLFLPLNPNKALILADDIWRLGAINPKGLEYLRRKGFLSDFIHRYGVIPEFLFINTFLNDQVKYSGLDTLAQYFTINDTIVIKSNKVDEEDTQHLNLLTYTQKNKQCVCKDIGNLIESLKRIQKRKRDT